MAEAPTTGEELRTRLEAVVAERVSDNCDWTIDSTADDHISVSLPDQQLRVQRRDGPDGVDHWTLELAADGATVSTFGPFEISDDLTERVEKLLDSDL